MNLTLIFEFDTEFDTALRLQYFSCAWIHMSPSCAETVDVQSITKNTYQMNMYFSL